MYRLITGLCLLAAVGCWGQAGYIQAKASLARWLIADAWQRGLEGGWRQKPWGWADTWPVARMRMVDRAGEVMADWYILAGAAGNSLAFAPGHLHGTSIPGEPGSSVVGGHRDTHFAVLADVNKGQVLQVQTAAGHWIPYRVESVYVADSAVEPLYINREETSIYLVTCYPFNAVTTGGSLRYVVKAIPAQGAELPGGQAEIATVAEGTGQ